MTKVLKEENKSNFLIVIVGDIYHSYHLHVALIFYFIFYNLDQ